MASLFDFSRHIANLKKLKQYKEALTFFKESKADFTNEQISQNEYIVSDLITCLRKINNFDAGFQFLSIYGIEINTKTKERILTSYGWLLWSKYKAKNLDNIDFEEDKHYFDEDEELLTDSNFYYAKDELIVKIESLLPLLFELNNDFCKTLISNLFTIVLKSEKKKQTPNWKLVNDFCNYFSPTQFSKECSIIQVERKGQVRDMELASDFENWYAYKTKALFKLGEWQECFDISKEALEKLDSFHYSNDIWFSRRIALSKKNFGNTEETISELKVILNKKREWFIQKELAELYLEKEDYDNAFKYAIDAINNFGPIEFKVDLLFLLGKINKGKNELDLALKHFSLSNQIRKSEGWKVPQKIIDELNQFDHREILTSDINTIKLELKKYWSNFKPKRESTHSSNIFDGNVIKIMHDNERGKDGFLKFNDSELYFSLSSNYHLTPKIKVNSKVRFKIIPASVGKKDSAKIIKLIE